MTELHLASGEKITRDMDIAAKATEYVQDTGYGMTLANLLSGTPGSTG